MQCRSRGAACCAQVMASVFSASNQSRLSKWKSSECGPSPLWEFEPTTEETGPEFDPLEPAGAETLDEQLGMPFAMDDAHFGLPPGFGGMEGENAIFGALEPLEPEEHLAVREALLHRRLLHRHTQDGR